MQNTLLILFFLTLSTQAYGAALSSSANKAKPGHELAAWRGQSLAITSQQQELKPSLSDKESKAKSASLPEIPESLKVSMPSLKSFAIEQLKKKFNTQLHDASSALARIWARSDSKDDFSQLLDASYKTVNRLHFFDAVSPAVVTLDPTTGIPKAITDSFLQHEDIAGQLCDLPLFCTLGRWPTQTYISIFNRQGYVAGDTKDCLYVFNYVNRSMISIPHTEVVLGIDKVKLLFSHDGTALARLVCTNSQADTRHKLFDLVVYATATGAPLYTADRISDNFSASPSLPFFTYTDQHHNTVIYDYTTKTMSSYRVVSAEEHMLDHVAKISPQGTFSVFVTKESDEAYTLRLKNNKTGDRFFVQRLSPTSASTWQSSVDVNSTESMMSVSDFHANTIKLIKIDSLTLDAPELTPSFEIRDCQRKQSTLAVRFSPDGTQAIIPIKRYSAALYDIAIQKRLTVFNDIQKAQFLSQHAILVTNVADARGNSPELYLQDTKQIIALGKYPSFCQETMKAVYEKGLNYLYIVDILTGQESRIDKESHHKTYAFDSHGTLVCWSNTTIAQLMIDPTTCTLDQLFFLLGMAHASQQGVDRLEFSAQLLSSPILATFSPAVRDYITGILQGYRAPRAGVTSSSAPASEKKEAS